MSEVMNVRCDECLVLQLEVIFFCIFYFDSTGFGPQGGSQILQIKQMNNMPIRNRDQFANYSFVTVCGAVLTNQAANCSVSRLIERSGHWSTHSFLHSLHVHASLCMAGGQQTNLSPLYEVSRRYLQSSVGCIALMISSQVTPAGAKTVTICLR